MDKKQATVTIVIPVRNRAELVGRTLRSIEAQTARPLEVVLVDNGSTDGTGRVLRAWAETVCAPDFRVTVLDEPRPGASVARNSGLAAVTTEWTLFFDSDDEMLPDHLARVVQAIASHPDADLIGWDIAFRRIDGSRRILPFEPDDIEAHNILHGTLATQRYCARTELFRRAGGWNEQVSIWLDIELGQRLLNLHPVTAKIQGSPTVVTHQLAESITGMDYTARLDGCLHTLHTMVGHGAPLGLIDLKRAVLAGDCRRAGHSTADVVMSAALRRQPSRVNRALMRIACGMNSRGLRGAGRLLYRFVR